MWSQRRLAGRSGDLLFTWSREGYFQINEFAGYLLNVDDVVIIIQPVTDAINPACTDIRDIRRLNNHKMLVPFYVRSAA